MTQEEINALYSLTISIHQNEWFGNTTKRRSRDEVQEWVAKQLALAFRDLYCSMWCKLGRFNYKRRI